MEWITVEERLPPQTVYVLVAKYDHRKNVEMYFVSIAERIGTLFYDPENDETDICSYGKYGRVTHWMAIPDPPTSPK